ncbi:acyltransferase family protein [Clostridium tertium]|jgi:fucose 4-O-acetylase-like acetyltransferase|nr:MULTISPECIES: acyltransferase family protein [Clostridium]MBS5305857.1 acyltransferase family protein [Clostridium sp.]MBS6503550.1 acyltransferase family protein [Clostridium sp.]MDB1922972.1 acyltransferase family protein [Clostridium tertium]MDB1925639.1 acyltransferase family protein [Clostridium tertium]MDB1929834.1 acyltransferase family protein [Clostridium tertium]
MEKLKKRYYLLDNLKVILIFFVVFGHVIEYYINDNSILMTLYIFIYIFHMPLFIFISGYLSKNFYKMKRKAIRNLLIPYIIFNMIWYTAVYIGTRRAMFSVLYPGWTLWYLLSLFFWRITLKYLIKFKHILLLSFIAGVLVGLIPSIGSILSISRTIVFLPFFLLGYYTTEEHLEKIKSFKSEYAITGILVFLLVAIYIVKNDLFNYKFLYNSYSYNALEVSLFEGTIFRIFLYFGAIIFSICVINLVPRKEQFFSKIGKATMNIYVFHIYLVMLVYFFIPKWNIGLLQNILILISPFIIIFILSRKKINKVYDGLFYPVNISIDTGKKSIKKYKKINKKAH